MTRYLVIPVLAVSLLSLSACQTAKTHSAKNEAAPVQQDFLATGRGLSKGAVDLYQPGTDFVATQQFPTSGRSMAMSAVSSNNNIVVNDPSVTIYNLDTMPVEEVQSAPLPPLQPPTAAKGTYPSPFDANGNFTK